MLINNINHNTWIDFVVSIKCFAFVNQVCQFKAIKSKYRTDMSIVPSLSKVSPPKFWANFRFGYVHEFSPLQNLDVSVQEAVYMSI